MSITSISLPIQYKILRETSSGVAFTDISASFGDGYSQVAPKGLNPKYTTHDIKWGSLTRPEFNTIISALDSVGSWGTILWAQATDTFSSTVSNVVNTTENSVVVTRVYFSTPLSIPTATFTVSYFDSSAVEHFTTLLKSANTYTSISLPGTVTIAIGSIFTLSLPKKYRMTNEGYKTSIVNNTLFSVSCTLKQVYTVGF